MAGTLHRQHEQCFALSVGTCWTDCHAVDSVTWWMNMASSLCWTSVSSTKCRTVLHGGQAYSLCDIANKHSWCGMSDKSITWLRSKACVACQTRVLHDWEAKLVWHGWQEYYMVDKHSMVDKSDKHSWCDMADSSDKHSWCGIWLTRVLHGGQA